MRGHAWVTPPPLHLHAICRSFLFFIVFCMIKSCNSLSRGLFCSYWGIKSCNSLSRLGWALKKPLNGLHWGLLSMYILPRQVQLHCTVQIQFCQPLKLIIDKFFYKLYHVGSNELQFVTKVQLLRKYTSFLVDFRTITKEIFYEPVASKTQIG